MVLLLPLFKRSFLLFLNSFLQENIAQTLEHYSFHHSENRNFCFRDFSFIRKCNLTTQILWEKIVSNFFFILTIKPEGIRKTDFSLIRTYCLTTQILWEKIVSNFFFILTIKPEGIRKTYFSLKRKYCLTTQILWEKIVSNIFLFSFLTIKPEGIRNKKNSSSKTQAWCDMFSFPIIMTCLRHINYLAAY